MDLRSHIPPSRQHRNARTHRIAAVLLADAGYYESAAAEYRRAIELDPNNGDACRVRSVLAYLCARLGDRTRAESEITQAMRLSPNDSNTQWMAATTYAAFGQEDHLLALLEAAPNAVIEDFNRWPGGRSQRSAPSRTFNVSSDPMRRIPRTINPEEIH